MIEEKLVCNVCGKVFDEWDEQENFGFDYHVGYGSKYDLTHLKAHICIGCFDKLMDSFIPACKISPDKGEYKLCGEVDICEVAFSSAMWPKKNYRVKIHNNQSNVTGENTDGKT